MVKKEVWIDCDPGHDDVMSILTALGYSDLIHVNGITTVCGNNLVDKVTENILNVLDYIGRGDIPVARGADKPLVYDPEPQDAHGKNGLEGFEFPGHRQSAVPESALEFLHNGLLKTDQAIVITMAPLTNLAQLFTVYPEVKSHIREVVLMGGGWQMGNILPHSEFNIYADPQAAKIVLTSGVQTVVMPLEACAFCTLANADIQRLHDLGTSLGEMAGSLMDFFAIYGHKRGWTEHTIFDLTTTMYVVHPEIFQTVRCHGDVICEGELTRGQTLFEPDEEGRLLVGTKADTELFRKYFWQGLLRLNEEIYA